MTLGQLLEGIKTRFSVYPLSTPLAQLTQAERSDLIEVLQRFSIYVAQGDIVAPVASRETDKKKE